MTAWQSYRFYPPVEQSSFNTPESGRSSIQKILLRKKKQKIVSSLKKAIEDAGFPVEKTWGETIEDRGSQVTYSALGQQAPLEEKEKWDADFAKRKKIKAILDTLIPEFSVRLGGATSIDVTKPGIDKAYGIKKLQETLGISVKEMIYVGDALFVGGNDYPAEQAGVISIPVRGPNETKRVIEAIIACLDRRSTECEPFRCQVRLFEELQMSEFKLAPPGDVDGAGARQSQWKWKAS